jgi:hypothetical protein
MSRTFDEGAHGPSWPNGRMREYEHDQTRVVVSGPRIRIRRLQDSGFGIQGGFKGDSGGFRIQGGSSLAIRLLWIWMTSILNMWQIILQHPVTKKIIGERSPQLVEWSDSVLLKMLCRAFSSLVYWKGGGRLQTANPPLVKKIHGSVSYCILFFMHHPAGAIARRCTTCCT